MRRHWYVSISIALLAVAAWAARQPGEIPRPGFNFFSKQQDMQLGQEAADQVRQQYQVVQNPFLQNYVKRVGDRLADTSEARQSGFPFTFTLLNDPQVNAFALPGGPMFILTGLVKSADNEAQLAGVMGHEMSHVILRHGTHEASKANIVELPLRLAQMVAGNSMMGRLASLGLGLGANSFILKFSRDAESEADALGARLMAEAGYDPMELARFFEKLQASGGQGSSRLSQFLSDHPNPGNRDRAILDEARTFPPRDYGFETGDFRRAKAEVSSLPAPPPRKKAATQ
jgi:predicted Zn-dependent protease